MSISEQEDLLDDICNDVLGYGPLEPLLARDEIADIMVNGSGTVYIEVGGKIQKTGIRFRDNQQLLEHLPAHRQPGRPPRRRILADLRRAPAGRLARQRHRAAAGDRRPGAHHPQVQEGQAHARATRAVRARSRPKGRDPQGRRALPHQHAGFRRHRLGQDDAAQLPDALHRPASASSPARTPPSCSCSSRTWCAWKRAAQPRRRGRDHHARSGAQLPAHAARTGSSSARCAAARRSTCCRR